MGWAVSPPSHTILAGSSGRLNGGTHSTGAPKADPGWVSTFKGSQGAPALTGLQRIRWSVPGSPTSAHSLPRKAGTGLGPGSAGSGGSCMAQLRPGSARLRGCLALVKAAKSAAFAAHPALLRPELWVRRRPRAYPGAGFRPRGCRHPEAEGSPCARWGTAGRKTWARITPVVGFPLPPLLAPGRNHPGAAWMS